MFWHHVKYSFATLFRSKILIFWTFAFPLILGTFFYMAFHDIESGETLDVIPIAIVSDEEFSRSLFYGDAFRSLSDGESKLFEIQYVRKEVAEQLLDAETVDGVIQIVDGHAKLSIKMNGIHATIIQSVLKELQDMSLIFSSVSADDTGYSTYSFLGIYQTVQKQYQDKTFYVNDTTREHMSYTMIEFYTLIAMTCLYGGILGMVAINQNLANMSSQGKRISVSPTSKGILIFGSALSSYVIQLIGLILLFLYTIFVLHVDYGTHLFWVIVLAMMGCLAGLSLGIFVATSVKNNDNVKTGLIISVTMLGCFFAGMMGITMKYIIDQNLPILNLLNPANMITDGFYSLYYYGVTDRFFGNFGSLFLFSVILIVLSIFQLRRQTYDHI